MHISTNGFLCSVEVQPHNSMRYSSLQCGPVWPGLVCPPVARLLWSLLGLMSGELDLSLDTPWVDRRGLSNGGVEQT